MSGVFVEVTFTVKGHTKPGEVMCIVGDVSNPGEWNPARAQVMTIERTDDDRWVAYMVNYCQVFW